MTDEDRAAIQAMLDSTAQSIIRQTTAAIQDARDANQAAIEAAEQRAQEFGRTIEANLLTAFHGYARGQTAHLRSVETTTHDMGIRIAALEERVLNLETRRQ